MTQNINPVKIAVDAMGGDYAPQQVIKGAVEAARDFDIEVVLVGPRETVQAELNQYDLNGIKLSIHPAEEVIGMDEDPVRAIRRKQDSSIVVGMNLIKKQQASAFVSGGSTGAVAAAALLTLGRKKGISRPALGITFDSLGGPVLLMDVGANSDCKPQNLLQFAQMGNVYMQKIYALPTPRIGLLSTGEEETKGNKLTLDSHHLLAKSNLNFIGNVEGQDLPKGGADVVVTDGFTGNVVIKLSEGLAEVLSMVFKQAGNGGASLGQATGRILNHTPGALLLGVKGNVVITHGKSDADTIKSSIHVAERMVEERVMEAIGT
ncbi:MAG: phosphate acyltransferase PlsX [Chloroflexi bacterium]|jgi:phosphate acyltransferase|nr:phosphate acyltransferase PlsX [Chloroflexota bacterium]